LLVFFFCFQKNKKPAKFEPAAIVLEVYLHTLFFCFAPVALILQKRKKLNEKTASKVPKLPTAASRPVKYMSNGLKKTKKTQADARS
jgi:hypothetical protein